MLENFADADQKPRAVSAGSPSRDPVGLTPDLPLTPRNDIAIYSPFAFAFYQDPASEARRSAGGGGGAELQTTLLARELVRRGLSVAHIVYPIEGPVPQVLPSLEIVERLAYGRRRGLMGRAREAIAIWQALSAADARAYVFRTGLSGGTTAFLVGAAFCVLRRRRLVFSASNDLDFVFDRDDRARRTEALYRLALGRTHCIVVQTSHQLNLARAVVRRGVRVALIPSFAERAEVAVTDEADAFLWASRIVDYKLPLRYLDLARALPEARFRMVAVETGETPAELAASVARGTAELPNLELLRAQPRDRVLALIARSPAVVLTSRHEGMPNVALEAWGRGVPVLSLHFDPDGKIATEGLGIWAAGSWERFVDGARELWREPGLRRELGETARLYIARVHSPEAIGQRWASELRGVLQ
jgi:glycosyltransferase involved in cell wall biosynthesis